MVPEAVRCLSVPSSILKILRPSARRTAAGVGKTWDRAVSRALYDLQSNVVHGGCRQLEATAAISVGPGRRALFRDGVPERRAATGERPERYRDPCTRLPIRLLRVLRGVHSVPGQLSMLVSRDYGCSMPIRGSRAVRDLPFIGSLVHVRREPEAFVSNYHGVWRCSAVQLRKRSLSAELVFYARGLGRWRTGEWCRAHGAVLLDLSCDASQRRAAVHAAWLLCPIRRYAVRLHRARFPGRFGVDLLASADRPALSPRRSSYRERVHRRGPRVWKLRYLRHGFASPVQPRLMGGQLRELPELIRPSEGSQLRRRDARAAGNFVLGGRLVYFGGGADRERRTDQRSHL